LEESQVQSKNKRGFDPKDLSVDQGPKNPDDHFGQPDFGEGLGWRTKGMGGNQGRTSQTIRPNGQTNTREDLKISSLFNFGIDMISANKRRKFF